MLVKIGHCSQSYHVYKCIVSTKTLDSVETYACKPFIIRLLTKEEELGSKTSRGVGGFGSSGV